MTFIKGKSGNPKGRPSKRSSDTESRAVQAVARMDMGWTNIATAMGTHLDKVGQSFYRPSIVGDVEALGLWRSEGVCRRVIEAKPKQAFRRGFTLKMQDKALTEDAMSDLEELGVSEMFIHAACMENAAGGSAIFAVTNDTGALSEPLNYNAVDLTAMHLLEPRELVPVAFYNDLRDPKWGKPETYRFMPLNGGSTVRAMVEVIHESRLIVFPGVKISRQTLPGQRWGWGDSALTGVYEAIQHLGNARGSAAHLLTDFAQGVLKLHDLGELLKEEGGEAAVMRRLQILDTMRSTMRSMVIDGQDDFSRTTTPVGGLADLLQQFCLFVAAVTGIPVTVLLGQAPAGLNATGDTDVRNWYDEVDAWRQHHIKCRLEQLIRLYFLSPDSATGGVEPDVWSVEFYPMWAPTDAEEAARRKTVAETDQIYEAMGAATNTDVAESRWKGDSYSSEMVIDWAARDAQKKVEEEMAQEARDRAEAVTASMSPEMQAQQARVAGGEPIPPNEPPPPVDELAKAKENA